MNDYTASEMAGSLERIAKALEGIARALGVGGEQEVNDIGESLHTIAMAMDGDNGVTIGQSIEDLRKLVRDIE